MRLCVLLLLLGLVSLAEPRGFQFVVRQLVTFEAWRMGAQVRINRVEGSLFKPVTLRNSVWSFRSPTGGITRIEIARTTADFAWMNLIDRSSNHWFQRLSLSGVTGKIDLPSDAAPSEKVGRTPFALGRLRTKWLPAPAMIEARDVEFLIQCKDAFVRLEQARFRVSELEPGMFKAGKVVIQQPWLRKTFTNVRGTTALQDSRVFLAKVVLEPEVEIKGFSAELTELAHGRFKQEIQIVAFGGTIRAEAETKPASQQLNFEASGKFSQINIAKLATFLALSDAAGGTIKEGNFSFRGSPQNLAKSTTRLWLNATNFQWESRQWDSLIFGAELIDRHLQVHDFVLHQGHNELTISGELTLPAVGQQWWQSDFQWNISARIENLTELSALLLPEFKFAAGRMHVEGSVRGHGEKFQGQLVVDGSNLQWRSAPIDELHATLKLNGNELQVSNFNIFNDGDYVRGQGVVNILGPTQYWGMLRGSVDDLGKYAAILQKPIVPEPLAGGAVIDWSGEGSAKGHSGKFLARLRKLRSLGASASLLHPINADLEGSYAAGGMVFSKFALSDDECSFTANVAVGNRALALQGIRVMHKQQLWLDGDALLPLDIWQAWPNTTLATLLNEVVQSKVALNAYDLELGAASKLSGWNFPIEGVVRGNFSAEGPLSALKTSGKLTLSKARIPLGWSDLTLTDVEGEATFEAQTMTLVKLAGRHPTGDFRAAGTIDLKNVRDPAVQLAVESDSTCFPVFQNSPAPATEIFQAPEISATLALQIEGPISGAMLRGTATPLEVQAGGIFVSVFGTEFARGFVAPDVTELWTQAGGVILPPVFTWSAEPWNAWRLDIACRTPETAPPKPSDRLFVFALRLGGIGQSPKLEGSISFRDQPFVGGEVLLSKSIGTLTWRDSEVFVNARATGELLAHEFTAHVIGPLRQPIRFFEFAPPLTDTLIVSALSGRYQSGQGLEDAARFPLRVPAVLTPDVEVFDWTIVDPPATHAWNADSAPPPMPPELGPTVQ